MVTLAPLPTEPAPLGAGTTTVPIIAPRAEVIGVMEPLQQPPGEGGLPEPRQLLPGQPEPLPPQVVRPEAGGAVPPPPVPGELPEPLPGPEPRQEGAAGPAVIEEISAPDEETALKLVVNRSKIFRINTPGPIRRVVVDNPRVAAVQLLDPDQPDPRYLNLYGVGFGRATLTVWDDRDRPSSYLVSVGIDAQALMDKLKEIVPGSNVTVRQVAQQVVLEGQVADIQMMSQVLELVQSELRLSGQENIGSLASAPGVTNSAGAGASGGGGAGQPGQNVAISNSPGQLSAANVGNAQPGLVIVNRVRVPGPRQVTLKVKIAELNRTALRQLGVSWLSTKSNNIIGSPIGGSADIVAQGGSTQTSRFSPGGLIPGTGFVPQTFSPVTSTFDALGRASLNTSTPPTFFGIFNAGEFNLFLNALRSNSLAKILAEPNLMAIDGQPASFQAGGQFPYPVPQSATAGGGSVITIQFANFGAILEFVPHILPNNVIRLDVAPTFSELNFGQGFAIPGAGVVPGINQRTARTVVELREGQTLAIAGLLSTRTNAFTNRIPGLGDLPIVGPLFSNNRIETVETELVVLVTPELVAPMEKDEVPPLPGDRVLEPNDYEFYFLGRIEGKTGHPFRATVHHHDPLEVMKHLQSENKWVVGPHGYAD